MSAVATYVSGRSWIASTITWPSVSVLLISIRGIAEWKGKLADCGECTVFWTTGAG